LKAPQFAYAKPRSLEEALDLLERPGAKVLAGGQSLIPSLNMRLSSPDLLVDIGAIASLAGVRVNADFARIGALATHTQIERSEQIRKHVPLLAEAAAHIAHPAIRNRGTLGGSLALADPAAEYPACALALDATIVILGRKGERRVKAADFFTGLFETDLKPGEILAAAEFPAGGESVFLELARRQGDYASAGIAAHRRSSEIRLAFFALGPTAILAKNAAAAAKKSVAAAQAALAKDLDPPADLYHSGATKLHLARVLLGRALAQWNMK
jgi:aerobic carbon-monoxide dehydrogenase medium subunit